MGEAQYQISASFELLEMRDIEAPVASTGRHDDCRGLHAPAIAQVEATSVSVGSRRTTSVGITILAPNFCAWT